MFYLWSSKQFIILYVPLIFSLFFLFSFVSGDIDIEKNWRTQTVSRTVRGVEWLPRRLCWWWHNRPQSENAKCNVSIGIANSTANENVVQIVCRWRPRWWHTDETKMKMGKHSDGNMFCYFFLFLLNSRELFIFFLFSEAFAPNQIESNYLR